MERKDFFERFLTLLENVKENYNLENLHDAFIVWFGENSLLLDPEDIKERIVQDKHAEGVDAVLLDKNNYKLFFVQAETVTNFEKTGNNFSENNLKLSLSGVRLLLKDYKGNITSELENLVDEYHELDKTCDFETVILFLSLKKEPVSNKFISSFRAEFPKIKIDFFTFDKLQAFYEKQYLKMRAAPPEKISFEIITNLLIKDGPTKSRVFTCKGKELARIYNDYKERIFQQNVRYSLGLRSKSINRQILETAKNEARSQKFWYFNNGITIVCKEIMEASSGKVINLKYAQIINGAQTTYALFEAYQEGILKEDVEVLIKVIESDDKEFIENVTLYTNSQNAIRLRDLCSNDEIQIEIQKILLDSYRYFYERKRGEIDSLYPTPEARKNLLGDNYKNKTISNENAAQSFLAMYLNKPAQAKSEKGRIFMKDQAGFYDDIFNKKDGILPEKILLSWKLLKYIEGFKKEYRKTYKKAEDLPDSEKQEIYKYDFLLHGEYFMLNLFRDFFKEIGFKIGTEKNDVLKVIEEIDKNAESISKCYDTIKGTLADYINKLKIKPEYYHNKFFKNEQSIGLVRNYFNSKCHFVEVI